jgi:hypothetical protein
VEKHYGVDWLSIAEIPDGMQRVRIPKLRVPWQPQIHTDRSVEVENVTALITLYNRLAEHSPELGRLVVEGNPLKPAALMFVPDRASRNSASPVKVKAFSLARILKSHWSDLRQDISQAQDRAMIFAEEKSTMSVVEGNASIHEETRLLVATGSEAFVDMVESIAAAYTGRPQSFDNAIPGSN